MTSPSDIDAPRPIREGCGVEKQWISGVDDDLLVWAGVKSEATRKEDLELWADKIRRIQGCVYPHMSNAELSVGLGLFAPAQGRPGASAIQRYRSGEIRPAGVQRAIIDALLDGSAALVVFPRDAPRGRRPIRCVGYPSSPGVGPGRIVLPGEEWKARGSLESFLELHRDHDVDPCLMKARRFMATRRQILKTSADLELSVEHYLVYVAEFLDLDRCVNEDLFWLCGPESGASNRQLMIARRRLFLVWKCAGSVAGRSI